MKIYCPSKNRPDSKLFEITEGLNIIIQTEEDKISYRKHKDRHNLIYVPGTKGLLDVRNWIYQYGDDDWVMMLDDDFLSYKRLINVNGNIEETDVSWDDFLKETEKITSELDKDKVGIVGFNNFSKRFSEQYQITEDFDLFSSVILNIPLLKSKGFRYESYPFDGKCGHSGFGEDVGLICFCFDNDIQMVRINNLKFENDFFNSSMTWGKNRNKLLFVSNLWHLGKYRKNEKIKKILGKYLFNCLFLLSINEIEDIITEIVKTVSYETLNFESEEEFVMKKFLIWGLVILVGAAGLVSCPEKTEGEKTVDGKYWGIWDWNDDTTNHFELTKNGYRTFTDTNHSWNTEKAWTEGAVLYAIYRNEPYYEVGTFKNDDTFLGDGKTYIRHKD